MQSIETVVNVSQERITMIVLSPDITFGKHHIVLVVDDTPSDELSAFLDDAPNLMRMVGQVTAFKVNCRFCRMATATARRMGARRKQ